MEEFASADAGRSSVGAAAGDLPDEARRRRISYFMLFRLFMLMAFTAVAAIVAWSDDASFDPTYTWFVWGTLGTGYALNLAFAWALPRISDLDRLASLQTAMDLVLSGVVVQMSGGVASGFSFLYLIAVLGAAIMGGRAQTFAAAGAALLIHLALSVLESLHLVLPLTPAVEAPILTSVELWSTAARTLAAIIGVAALSAFLNLQLRTSARVLGSLRALNENIVRSLNSGLVTADSGGRIIYANPAAHSILRREDLVGQPLVAILPVAQDTADSSGGVARTELDVARGDGSSVHLGLSTAPLKDADDMDQGTIVNFQDLTTVHELAMQVRRSERLAAIGELAASVAHEIRNPLAAISGSAELLSPEARSDEERRLLGVVTRESARLNKLITGLLAFARDRPPTPSRFDLRQSVQDIAAAFEAEPENAAISLRVDAPDRAFVHADAAQITQVLWNLVRNAADAIETEGEIQIKLTVHPQRVNVRVSDDGPGMDAQTQRRVFDPFFTTKEAGTGFGLALAQRVVEEHGATLCVRSELGRGASFEFHLAASPEPTK